MDNKAVKFGEGVWDSFQKTNFGSLPKREMELLILRAAIDAGLLEDSPSRLASGLRIILTKAHGYLNLIVGGLRCHSVGSGPIN